MKPGRGRRKGSSFERKIAKMITSAFKDRGIKPSDAYRTPMSGGHRFASKKDPGDIVMSKRLRKLFPFSIECKFHKGGKLEHFLKKKRKKQYTDWLDQTVTALQHSNNRNCLPLLVFKGNNTDIFCALRKEPRILPPYLTFRYKGGRWCVILFSQLLAVYNDTGEK